MYIYIIKYLDGPIKRTLIWQGDEFPTEINEACIVSVIRYKA